MVSLSSRSTLLPTTGTEIGDEERYFEAEDIREEGSQVDVHLDHDFKLPGTAADHESSDDQVA
jgi:hypothetical protein